MTPALNKYLRENGGGLTPENTEWLQLLLGDWQIMSDLLFSDLVLWLPTREGDLTAVAHCRPATNATVYYEDPVGRVFQPEDRPLVRDVFADAAPRLEPTRLHHDDLEAFAIAVPVVRGGGSIAVLTAEYSTVSPHLASEADQRFRALGTALLRMVVEGDFPIVGAPIPTRRGAPRAADGVVELDEEGIVQWASPNAFSAFHRFGVAGDMRGHALAELATDVIQSRSPVDESLPLVLTGRVAWRSDLQARGGTLALRAIPLTQRGRRVGAIVLCRDVSELRRRERELITRDATIREVHHRVKNNLQTVAALLRMQSRRVHSVEAQQALGEAMRRVSTIALVHEALLQGSEETVNFDDVLDRCLTLSVDVAAATVRHSDTTPLTDTGQFPVRTERIGKVGLVRAEEATPLALVLTELATNAVEHGLQETGGMLTVRAERTGAHLVLAVEDDGTGLGSSRPDGFGTSIARTLVSEELGGTIGWENRDEGGTRALIDVYLDPIGI